MDGLIKEVDCWAHDVRVPGQISLFCAIQDDVVPKEDAESSQGARLRVQEDHRENLHLYRPASHVHEDHLPHVSLLPYLHSNLPYLSAG